MASGNALSLLGWMFLPNLVTGWAQSIYYGLTIRAGDPRPAPNSPRYQQHRRRIHTLVITVYLLYTLYEADWELRRSGNYYHDLGVPFDASEKDIKSRFRRLAALHHPDKTPHTGGGFDGSSISGDGYFIHLKTASDVLTNRASRFAYERFGPSINTWRECVTIKDYLWRGLQMNTLPHYGIGALGLYGLGLLGYLEFGRYWRWVVLMALCVFEFSTVTRPEFPVFVSSFVNPVLSRFTTHPPYLPFQVIELARRGAIAIFIAFGQLGPVLQAGKAQQAAAGEKALNQSLDRLEHIGRAMDVDAGRLMDLEMTPFVNDPEVMQSMRSKLKEWLIQNTIRSDPMVRDALGRSMQKRRMDAPPGARGKR
ncbi:membrane associated DnaJ chaperone-like protein [Xylariaceae sp. FL1272]|nr:membrane associated DnaJ chaperone-like protein [Xylariaceae sp. FL1272]